jgi:oleate hydratase
MLIRDADFPGHNITILEELDRLGGSLDGAGSPQQGYVLRGGRMIESKYLCTYDLFSSIPTLDERKTVTKEIFDWNETMKTSSHSRLVRDGQREDAPEFGLSEKDILTLERLMLEPEEMLAKSSIADQFDPGFFVTNFWLMWCTTFAFQPWHSAVEFKRYLLRFTHMVEGFNRLHGIMRTVYNQYDSMVRPLQKWLDAHGVHFALNTRVTDLVLRENADGKRVERIVCERHGDSGEITTGADDLVIVTLGSMTEASSLDSMDSAPALKSRPMAVPGHCGRRSQPAGRNLADPRFLLITLKSLNGFRLPLPCTIQLSSDSSVTSPAMFLARADSSLLQTLAGSLRLCCRTNRTLSGNPKTWMSSGVTACSSTNWATS